MAVYGHLRPLRINVAAATAVITPAETIIYGNQMMSGIRHLCKGRRDLEHLIAGCIQASVGTVV
jgi:hypothetical protein